MNNNSVNDIRQEFCQIYQDGKFITDKTGKNILEIHSCSFIADEPYIFGEVNHDYVKNELNWYLSKSLNVYDIPGKIPKIWKMICDEFGFINSNYGWCIYSEENVSQFNNCTNELISYPDSRRAVMIYTRPSMWNDYNTNGMSDFICTNAVQYLIRDNKVHSIVQMRSNDAWAGYRNDYAWQLYVLTSLVDKLNSISGFSYEVGNITWQVGSLHLYSNQFYLIDHYIKTGESSITKQKYDELYRMGY